MANLNRIILVGKLVADPDTKSTVEGIPVTRFKLAVNRFQREGAPQATDFIDVVTWRRLAEVAGQYLRKGNPVLIEGRIQVRSFEDQTGQRKWATEVIARNMQMLGGPAGKPAEKEAEPAFEADSSGGSFMDEASDTDDDLPF